MSEFDIDLEACRGRQRRLLAVMERLQLDLVMVNQAEHVQWLSGVRLAWVFHPLAALRSDGRLVLAAPNRAPEAAAADDVAVYVAQRLGTIRNDQGQASMAALAGALAGDLQAARRVGVEFSTCGRHLQSSISGQLVDVEPALYELRRRKDADELRFIKKAIEGSRRMYERARQIVRPGVTELEVFSQLQAAVVDEFGEVPTGMGNDFQCGSPGGPPRTRSAQAGELYILDLGPAFRGYFTDNCRTIAVSEPTDGQYEAWGQVERVLGHVERAVRPGVSARALFEEARAMLAEAPVGEFPHHLGHGFGLFPHEAPHLNPEWDDTFQAGEVFSAEPGLYAPELRAGVRVENNYLVTDTGVELLSDFSTEL